jgi:hypothetical protein
MAMDKKVIPQAGQSMEEGTILSWKAKIVVNEGQSRKALVCLV